MLNIEITPKRKKYRKSNRHLDIYEIGGNFKEYYKNMNEYRLDQATRPIEKFIEDLSTWWLRRSRERLKEDIYIEDKSNAEFTIYKILNEFSK